MDRDSQRTSQAVSTVHSDVDSSLLVDHAAHPAACALCRRILVPESDDLDTNSICGDCKFLLLEDLGTPTQNHHVRRPQRRRVRYSSSESFEDLLSQQLSHLINLARQNQSTISGHEDQSVDDDYSVMLLQNTSSHTTPSGSGRWQQVLSDAESEGFDNMNSVYWESETNLSVSRYRVFHSESDAISFSGYGGESDASVDGRSFLDRDIFIPPDAESNLESVSDIDPMHAGLNQWNSGDAENDDEEEDGEWEEAEDAIDSVDAVAQLPNFLISNPYENNDPINWFRQLHSFDFEGQINQRVTDGTYNHLQDFGLNSRDHPNARGLEDFLEHLVETDSSRRGAPPAALSVVNSLPHVIIGQQHEKHEDLACAICKDVLLIGTEVSQLPCRHFYHPRCILPWLGARNSCPLCRYELPTDDRDYEEGKERTNQRLRSNDIRQQDLSEDDSSHSSDEAEAFSPHEFGQDGVDQRHLGNAEPATRSSGRNNSRSWFFLAAAPIVSLVGIVLVLWLGNSQGRGPNHHCNFTDRGLHQINVSGSSSANPRADRNRRWWSLF
uniref:RING-type E3 ubiquitin transferase n=1 Tax=Rhizophora mucronata TaxID=61149 RepID=A0A2P2L1C1_RHIMU